MTTAEQKDIELRKISSGYQVSIGKYLDNPRGRYLRARINSKGEIVLTPVLIVDAPTPPCKNNNN